MTSFAMLSLALTILFGAITVVSGTSWATSRTGDSGRARGDAAAYFAGALGGLYLAVISWVTFLDSLG